VLAGTSVCHLGDAGSQSEQLVHLLSHLQAHLLSLVIESHRGLHLVAETLLPCPLQSFQRHRTCRDSTDDQRKVLDPILLSVVALAKTEVHFPLNSWKIQTPNIVVAAAKSAISNSWTKGILHRDFLDERTSGVCTFMIFIDEVNQANGSVEIWTDSQWIPLDEKILNGQQPKVVCRHNCCKDLQGQWWFLILESCTAPFRTPLKTGGSHFCGMCHRKMGSKPSKRMNIQLLLNDRINLLDHLLPNITYQVVHSGAKSRHEC
jgi:hypothetical protein